VIWAAVGRVLYVVIMAVALTIGFVAGWVGWGMEMVAAGIAAIARVIARITVLVWRSVIVPLSMFVAAAAKWAWRRSRLGSTRAALAIRAGAIWAMGHIKAGLISVATQIREGATWSAARVREGFIWCGLRTREGAQSAGVLAKAGAIWTAGRSKQLALLSGMRTKEGAAWTAARAKKGAAWSARKIAESSRSAWDRALLPGAKRAASGAGQAQERIKLDSARLMTRAREHAIAFGAWSAKLPGAALTALLTAAAFVHDRARAAKNAVIDARRRQVEASVAARAARRQVEKEALDRAETERQTKAETATGIDAEPAPAEEQRPPAKAQKTLSFPAGRYVLDRVNSVKNVVIDARKRHAEAGVAARAARKVVEEEAARRAEAERQTEAAAEKEADSKPVSAGEQAPAHSKKKKKTKQDSVGV
jgi:hypothetical protein